MSSRERRTDTARHARTHRRRTDQPHGTVTRYCTGCRCDDCRAAHAARARWRRRMHAYGRAVPKSVPNAGARRRIEALQTLGWSMRDLSRMLGKHPDRLSVSLKTYDGISPANHALIAGLYDRLWSTPAPQRDKGERISAQRTIARAQREGYLPPLAWDDETIDDPDARPAAQPERDADYVDEALVDRIVTGRHRVPLGTSSPERVEAVRRLARRGLTDTDIARIVGGSRDGVAKLRERHRITAGTPHARTA